MVLIQTDKEDPAMRATLNRDASIREGDIRERDTDHNDE